jgi:hypothetical protein
VLNNIGGGRCIGDKEKFVNIKSVRRKQMGEETEDRQEGLAFALACLLPLPPAGCTAAETEQLQRTMHNSTRFPPHDFP